MKVYVELFLLDNAVMTYLILCGASALAHIPLQRWRVIAVCSFCAACSAVAMVVPQLLTLPVKLALLCVMCVPFKAKGVRERGKTAICVLLSTFVCAGLAYALCFHAEGNFSGGTLYASGSVRTILLAVFFASFLPRLIRFVLFTKELTKCKMNVILSTGFGSTTLKGYVDTGNQLLSIALGLPVVIVDEKVARCLFPVIWNEKTYCPGMDFALYKSVSGSGILPVLRAEIEFEGHSMPCSVGMSKNLVRCEALIHGALFNTQNEGSGQNAHNKVSCE